MASADLPGEEQTVGKPKPVRLLIPAALALLAASQWPDVRRYFKIRQLSLGQGHPANVPARGRAAYPQDPARAQPDGTGDFDSASRGGPARRRGDD
jgi:uncharacterized protein DUF6893